MPVQKVKDFILKHCERKAKEQKVPTNQIQVRFALGNDCSCGLLYTTCKQFGSVEWVYKDGNKQNEDGTYEKNRHFETTDFKTICNFFMGYDALGYSEQVPPLILNALICICDEKGIEPEKIFVFAAPDENFITVDAESGVQKKERLAIHVYNGGTGVERLSVDQFVLDNIMKAQALK